MQLIEQYTHTEDGYNPLLVRPKWQVAILNYAQAESLEAIDKLDVHHQTDEVFMLLEGRSVLIAASIHNDVVLYQTIDMKRGIIYNIPRNVWHKIAMYQGSSVLIVENADTHLGDFEFYNLSENQKMELKTAVLHTENNN